MAKEPTHVFLCILVAWQVGCISSLAERQSQQWQAWHRYTPPIFTASDAEEDPFANHTVLERSLFVQTVLMRNPSLQSVRQAWRSALAQVSQVTTLEDPMLEYAMAPLSIGSRQVPFGQAITLRQNFPWPGNLSLQGEVALAEADAASGNFQAARHRLAVMAAKLFDAYYVVTRALEINAQHQRLLANAKDDAAAQYSAGRVSQQELLAAELELAHMEHEQVVLDARRANLTAQLNGLLRRPPEQPLPPPPQHLEPNLSELPQSAELRDLALRQRPELQATQAHKRARASAVLLAEREYFPNVGVMGSYNSMWSMTPHQWMVGVSVNLPIQLGARAAAVEQAQAQQAQAEAMMQEERDTIAVQVEQARQSVLEAQHVVHLYRTRILPAAQAQIDAARAGYSTGETSFQGLLETERAGRTAELNHQQALATLSSQWSELHRALGSMDVAGDTQ